jgi:hypothetical protein
MSRIYRASVSFFGDLKSNAAPYRKLFGAYFTVALVIFITTTLINYSFNGVLIGKAIGGYINLILMFILFNALISDKKSFVESAREINPRILLNLVVILVIYKIPSNINAVFQSENNIFFNSAIAAIVQMIISLVLFMLSIYEYCLLYFAAENPHEKVGTTLFGGILIMKKMFFPTFFLLIGYSLFTYFVTAVISIPLISILGSGTLTTNIASIAANIIAIALSFLYTGVFVKLCSDA